MERYVTSTYRLHELKWMNKIMSLLACIYMVWVFIEFQSLVHGPGMSFVGESSVRRLRRHAATVSEKLKLYARKKFQTVRDFIYSSA